MNMPGRSVRRKRSAPCAAIQIRIHQPGIAQIGLESDIEHVPEHRDRTHCGIQRNISTIRASTLVGTPARAASPMMQNDAPAAARSPTTGTIPISLSTPMQKPPGRRIELSINSVPPDVRACAHPMAALPQEAPYSSLGARCTPLT